MIPPHITIEYNGNQHILYPGSIIGRLAKADLRIDDPRISEAHALISLRGNSLKMLALRGSLTIKERIRGETVLDKDMEIKLTDEHVLKVVSVHLPEYVLTVQYQDETISLTETEMSIHINPLRFEKNILSTAVFWVWQSGEAWWYQRVGSPETKQPIPLETTTIDTFTFSFCKLIDSGFHTESNKLRPPLKMAISTDVTQITFNNRFAVFTGRQHDVIKALADLTIKQNIPAVSKDTLTETLWPNYKTQDKNWHMANRRLKEAFKEAGLPQNLIVSNNGTLFFNIRSGIDEVSFNY